MSFIMYTETIKDVMYDVDVIPGQIVHAIDTNETFFDTSEYSRIILEDVIYLNKELEKEQLLRPLTNKVYIVKETKIPYRYEGTWFEVTDEDRLLCALLHDQNFTPTIVKKGDKKIAPNTLATAVYNDFGKTIDVEIESSDKLTLCKTKYVYVESTSDNQKVFKIPYPISDYDFRKNFMLVVINGVVIEETRFTIRDDDYFVLNDNELGLDSGQLVLFIFYYNVYIDINDGVLLYSKNLRDRSVTEPKLDNNAVSERTIINRNVTNSKLADHSVDKRVISPGTIDTTHIDLDNIELSADNIIENDNRKFVSQVQIDSWTNESKMLLSATAPTQFKANDVWVDTTNFIFKIRNSANNAWVAMGAVYK